MAAGTAMVTLHEVRFKGREQHGIRAFCTCGWRIDIGSGKTLTELAILIKRHGLARMDTNTMATVALVMDGHHDDGH